MSFPPSLQINQAGRAENRQACRIHEVRNVDWECREALAQQWSYRSSRKGACPRPNNAADQRHNMSSGSNTYCRDAGPRRLLTANARRGCTQRENDACEAKNGKGAGGAASGEGGMQVRGTNTAFCNKNGRWRRGQTSYGKADCVPWSGCDLARECRPTAGGAVDGSLHLRSTGTIPSG